ncbi:hypothetical protein HCJ39_11840 [Listeria rocourtiae]|uniref:hypothetical protein n=1 Tax=Listeria rocourtiae TaxID=647910 RepID=UPI001624C9F9|nr:hypothetical protein [Listeria rocourtiae]MBC1436383.1 hypothetical protein [Listeria rocourtiae]MBC1605408.1 hypothetical protein [Listeria rocourtiae]
MLYSFEEIERQLENYKETDTEAEHVSVIKTASSSTLNQNNDKYSNAFKQNMTINSSLMNL